MGSRVCGSSRAHVESPGRKQTEYSDQEVIQKPACNKYQTFLTSSLNIKQVSLSLSVNLTKVGRSQAG